MTKIKSNKVIVDSDSILYHVGYACENNYYTVNKQNFKYKSVL